MRLSQVVYRVLDWTLCLASLAIALAFVSTAPQLLRDAGIQLSSAADAALIIVSSLLLFSPLLVTRLVRRFGIGRGWIVPAKPPLVIRRSLEAHGKRGGDGAVVELPFRRVWTLMHKGFWLAFGAGTVATAVAAVRSPGFSWSGESFYLALLALPILRAVSTWKSIPRPDEPWLRVNSAGVQACQMTRYMNFEWTRIDWAQVASCEVAEGDAFVGELPSVTMTLKDNGGHSLLAVSLNQATREQQEQIVRIAQAQLTGTASPA